VPFVGRAFETQAAVMEYKPNRDLLLIDDPLIYACADETITCENGHPICDFIETVYVGQHQDVERQLGNWRGNVVVGDAQFPPPVGTLPIPVCKLCGERFTTGGCYHFADGWRGQR
jgi:hypothetical protein